MKILNDKYITLFNYEDSKNFLKALKKAVNFISGDEIKNKYTKSNFDKFSDVVNNNLISNLKGLAILQNRFFRLYRELPPFYLDEDFFKEKASEVLEDIYEFKSFSTTNEGLINRICSDLNAYTFLDRSCEETNSGDTDKIDFDETKRLIEMNSGRVSYLLSDVMFINNRIINKVFNDAITVTKMKSAYQESDYNDSDFGCELDHLNDSITVFGSDCDEGVRQEIINEMIDELNDYLSNEMLNFDGNATYEFYSDVDVDGNGDFPVYVGIKLDLNGLDIDSQLDYLESLRDLFGKVSLSKDNFGVIGISYDGQDIDVHSYEKF